MSQVLSRRCSRCSSTTTTCASRMFAQRTSGGWQGSRSPTRRTKRRWMHRGTARRRPYAALALCSRIGYGCSYELLHFAWDFNLWSALGAKKSTSVHYGVPMRVLVKGQSFSPLYCLSVHWALIDMVCQLGYPKIFWTLSPYEWSMPCHEWVRDEVAKCLRARLRLPLAETLHLTHVLFQTVKGLLIGSTGNKKTDPWQRHICRALDEDGVPFTVHAFCRLEFQDGSKKAPTQGYHGYGSGRPHMHVLVFDLQQGGIAQHGSRRDRLCHNAVAI